MILYKPPISAINTQAPFLQSDAGRSAIISARYRCSVWISHSSLILILAVITSANTIRSNILPLNIESNFHPLPMKSEAPLRFWPLIFDILHLCFFLFPPFSPLSCRRALFLLSYRRRRPLPTLSPALSSLRQSFRRRRNLYQRSWKQLFLPIPK